MRWVAVVLAVIMFAGPAGAAPMREVVLESSPAGAQVFDQTYTAGHPDGFVGVAPCHVKVDGTTSHDFYFVLDGWTTVKGRVHLGQDRLSVALEPASLRAYGRRYPWIPLLAVAAVAAVAWRLRGRFARLQREVAVAQLDSPNLIGRVIGSYRVAAAIGEGAYAEVFRVEHVEYGDAFAMKVLRRDVSDGDVRKRFANEMSVGRDLRHPNLVPVYAFGELWDGRPYMVLELLEGRTLEARLRFGAMPPAEAVDVLRQMVDGLEYAHENGVIHRDLKPGNVMLAPDGRVRIMDFGIARLLGRARLTASNATMGTPLYMSPEHLDARTIDERSDVYSLGVIAYEMLTGAPPFAGEEAFAVIAGHLRGKVTAIDRGRIPGPLADVVMRMVERDLGRRLPDMAAVREALTASAVPR